jgi:hypothetical protein
MPIASSHVRELPASALTTLLEPARRRLCPPAGHCTMRAIANVTWNWWCADSSGSTPVLPMGER